MTISAASMMPAPPSSMSPLPTIMIFLITLVAHRIFELFQLFRAFVRNVGETPGDQHRLHRAATGLKAKGVAFGVAIVDPGALRLDQRLLCALHVAIQVLVDRRQGGARLLILRIQRLVGSLVARRLAASHVRLRLGIVAIYILS